ncbi:protein kinase [Streptomyces sp. NPDC088812]|uniref:serine/threonine-protein kinase n=1 Tax=Streptomyces sp. NPDC088812 TaxID=3365905 RepID=UPI00380F4C57
MGRVWRAADDMLDRQVAVKEMRIDGLDAEDARTRRERTLREARATARIDHPNVVRVYDVVDEGERLWIVMELVAGRSLERITAEAGPLDPRATARIGLGLVTALHQVHARGVLHRDIKPGNVLVEDGGERVVLTDFGIAAIQDTTALTMAGMLVGSPDYMAPERISGRPQGPPSDVWSLGATLCAALAGHSPFSRDTTLATLHAVLYEEPELPPTAGPLRDVLAALLEKEPTVRARLTDLESVLRPVAFPTPAPPPPIPPPTPLSPTPVTPAAGEEPADPRRPEPHAAGGTPLSSRPGVSLTRSQAPTGRSPAAPPGRSPAAPPGRSPAAPTERSPAAPTERSPAPPPERSPATPPGRSPAAAPAPAPRPTGRRPRLPAALRRRTALAAATGVTAVAAAVGIALASSGSGHGGNQAGSSPTHHPATTSATTPTPTPAPTPTSTVEGTSRPPSLPPGAHQEAGGYAWATPEGWRRDVKTGAEVHYTSPDGTQELVASSSLAQGDLMDTWRASERNAHQGRDYRKIRLEETTFRGNPAVVWEYTFTLQGTPWHARLLGFDEGGTSYQINTWYQPHVEAAALRTYDEVKESFTVL